MLVYLLVIDMSYCTDRSDLPTRNRTFTAGRGGSAVTEKRK